MSLCLKLRVKRRLAKEPAGLIAHKGMLPRLIVLKRTWLRFLRGMLPEMVR